MPIVERLTFGRELELLLPPSALSRPSLVEIACSFRRLGGGPLEGDGGEEASIRIAAAFGLVFLLLPGVETGGDEEIASGDPGGGRDEFAAPLGDALLCRFVFFGSLCELARSPPMSSAALCFPVTRAVDDGDAFVSLTAVFPFDLLWDVL